MGLTMAFIKTENREGKPIIAEIYQDTTLVGTTNPQGELELASGDYVAKAEGYDSKRFRVHNQATPHFVTMASLSQVNQSKSNATRNTFTQTDWAIFFALGIIFIGIASGALIASKKKNSILKV
jgi:uncharacterized membrane protein YcjF (UPF0283 family)